MRREFGVGHGLAWLVTAAVPAMVLASTGYAGAQTLPSGGKVTAGTAAIATVGSITTVSQSSSRAIITWNDFSIGKGANVQFNNGSGATLNRVTGAAVSSINGVLGATGSVYLINPNGVVVGKTGVVKTGGSFVASTHDLGDGNFLSGGDLTFSGTSTASVVNLGSVGSLGGNVVLIGGGVENDGAISAANGTAGLVAGRTVLMKDTASEAGLFTVAVGGADTSVTNTGTIAAASAELRANGGSIYALAGNAGGIISATGVAEKDGHVWLIADNGTVKADGTITARQADGDGGTVETSGGNVDFTGLVVDTRGTTGKTGNWLVDPTNLVVDSSAAATISSNLATSDVTLQTTATGASGPGTQSPGAGDIIIGGNISWSSGNTLTVNAYHGIIITSDIIASGPGKVVLMTANGGDYDFGLNLSQAGVSGAIEFTDTPGAGQALTINGQAYTLLYSMSDVASASGYVALANSIYAGGTTYTSSVIPTFNGTFTGLGNAISYLTINSNGLYVGLTGQNNGTIRNLNLLAANIYGSNYATGAFSGWNNGSLDVNWLTGTVQGGGSYVGGFAGVNNYGTVTANRSNDVTINSSAYATGGAVGWNSGVVSQMNMYDSMVTGTGTVTGGLVGDNDIGFVINASLYDNIVSGSGEAAGELIGWNRGYVGYNTVENLAYTGGTDYALTGSASHMGGLIGVNLMGIDQSGGLVVDNAAWDSVTAEDSGVSAGGLIGWNSGTVSGDNNAGLFSGEEVRSNAGAVGGLVGWNQGVITGAQVSGTTLVPNGVSTHSGGLVGVNDTGGSISQASVNVIDETGVAASMGGVVGWNAGLIDRSYIDSGSVTETATGDRNTGGFVGVNTGTIQYAYATSTPVTGVGLGTGGFVGYNQGSMNQVLAANTVSGGYYHAGFAGISNANVTDSYWDTQVSGTTTAFGLFSPPSSPLPTLTGYTTAQLSGTLPAGFDSTYWKTTAKYPQLK